MSERHVKRAQFFDRVATGVITGGGVAIIAAVILILVLIVRVSLPLFYDAEATSLGTVPSSPPENATLLAAGVDEYLETVLLADSSGRFRFVHTDDGAPIAEVQATPPSDGATVRTIGVSDAHEYGLHWTDGVITLATAEFMSDYDGDSVRTIRPEFEEIAQIPPPEGEPLATRAQARRNEDGRITRIDIFDDGRIGVTQLTREEDIFGEVTEERAYQSLGDSGPGAVTAFTLGLQGESLFVGKEGGRLIRWDLAEPGEAVLRDSARAFDDGREITSLSMVLGNVSLAVGDSSGGLSTWSPVRTEGEDNEKHLRLIHTLESHESAVTLVVPSLRNKSLLSLSAGGVVHLDHMTSNRHLLNVAWEEPLKLIGFSPRANGMVGVDEHDRVTLWTIENSHPEISLKTLFGKVWYENYDEPEFVWQSSAATDEFEPKLSLTPLLFGSFKGTAYAMLYAIPLALFAAIYTSQFATPRVRGVVKPVVEVMAAIPSVVIGFLVALWLAPIVEDNVVAVLLAVPLLPVLFIVFTLLWSPLQNNKVVARMVRGSEFILLAPVILASCAIVYYGAQFAEVWLFGGNFKLWLFQDLGQRYDQRNCIIIAFGLGFAVIPIIFTITEDALSNVPPPLTAASMALGATRWETVWHVVLPSASPGIFAAIMIGFGRAIGETMIVLMATGNTPIMDWSVFNGMRTLSANIAVEIPEAPEFGTLYRVLFLSAVILFLMTSVVNTGAEMVRQYLRRKYGQF